MSEARFDGKVALVTGAGSGIGRAVTLRLASEGAEVLAHDLNGDALAETAKLVADAGATMTTRTGDISSRDECAATVAAAVDQFGGLDVLGNIAGIARAEHFPDVEERAVPPDDGRERRRLLLPRAGGDPSPARARGQHRQHRVERRPHGPGLHRRLLHDQGRDRADRRVRWPWSTPRRRCA